jgi:hypothetical protein
VLRVGAGADPRPLALDDDVAHPLGLDQDRALEGAQGDRPVPRPLPGDLEARVAGEAEDLGDVVGALDEGDPRRLLIGRQVPRLPRLVPVGVGRRRQAPANREVRQFRHGAAL